MPAESLEGFSDAVEKGEKQRLRQFLKEDPDLIKKGNMLYKKTLWTIKCILI